MADRENGLPRPAPGTRGVKEPGMPKEKTCNWPGAPGQKGPKMNRVGGFHEVKQSAKQDMADDIYGNGPAEMGGPVMAQVPPELMPDGMPMGMPVGMMPGRPNRYLGPPIRDIGGRPNPYLGPPIRGDIQPPIRPSPRRMPRMRNRVF